MRIGSVSVLAFLTLVPSLLGQSMAPRETASLDLKGKKVFIEYGRPALNHRSLDDLLKSLRSDRMWRAGSEQVTTLTTETDLLIGGKTVPAGKYSVYVHCPESGDYALLINKVIGQPLGKIWSQAPAHLANEPWPHFDYDKEIGDQEVARVPLRKGAAEEHQDRFKISFTPSGEGAVLTLAWGKRLWSVEVEGG